MSKPLAGTRWFEAQGRSACARGLPLLDGRARNLGWPMWARVAWARGWVAQGRGRAAP